MNTLQPDLLKTRKHFEILDGLRGVAAVVVVIFHFMEIVYPPAENFAGHGFLAVDFFFCLSGFVIAYAYGGDRVAKLGVAEFFKSRLIRLHPLVVLGSVLGLLAFLFDPFTPTANAYSAGQTAVLFITSALLIPYAIVNERYNNLFNLNAPAWSLFWEYVANVFYGLVLWRLSKWILALLLAFAAVGLGIVAYRAGNLVGGWSSGTFWDGGVRVAYSFLAGMIVYRFNFAIRNKLGFAGISVLLLAGLLMPHFKYNWAVELGIVLIYFPLLVALGAGATLSPSLKGVCNFSGRISYPLYMTHYSVMWIFGGYYAKYKPGAGQLALIIIVSLPILIGLAYLAMRYFDEPLRKYLTEKRKVKTNTQN